MINYFLVFAVILMLAGIVGSFLPALPGPLLSMIGASVYFWSTGYTEPRPIIFSLIIFTGIFALGLDYLAGYIGADRAEASQRTAIAAGVASFLLFFVSGPFGILIGTGAVVLLRELMLGKDFDQALKAAAYTTLGMLASVFAKAGLTFLMLVVFLITVLL